MKEIIQKWGEFTNKWNQDPENIKTIFDENDKPQKMVFKASFYDFMEWLANNENQNSSIAEEQEIAT